MRVLKALAVAIAIALALGACKKASPTAPTPTAQSVAISGTANFANKNQTSQLTASVTMSDSTTKDVTSSATWVSSNSSIASVTSAGVVTALGNGTATITATYEGKSATVAATIALKATLAVSSRFIRQCTPFRAGLDITMSETSGNAGLDISQVTVYMWDWTKTLRFTKVYSAAELASLMGSKHINAGSARVLPLSVSYGGAETDGSSVRYIIVFTDDSGNSSSVDQSSAAQLDYCA